MPRFSIILPTRDRPQWIGRAVASVTLQSFEDWELIILDNSDEPYVPRPWADQPRVRYVHQLCNGVADASARALALAQGDIICPLADDDRLVPWALETVHREIGDHDWLYARTAYQNVDGVTRLLLGDRFDLARLRRDYYLGGAVYWKRGFSERLGVTYSPEYDGAADYDLYLRFAEAAEPKWLDQVLYLYTDWGGTDSRVHFAKQQTQTTRIRQRAANAAASASPASTSADTTVR